MCEPSFFSYTLPCLVFNAASPLIACSLNVDAIAEVVQKNKKTVNNLITAALRLSKAAYRQPSAGFVIRRGSSFAFAALVGVHLVVDILGLQHLLYLSDRASRFLKRGVLKANHHR